MSTKLLARSFAGGEITNELSGRLDLSKFQTGLSLCRNFIVLPHGPAVGWLKRDDLADLGANEVWSALQSLSRTSAG